MHWCKTIYQFSSLWCNQLWQAGKVGCIIQPVPGFLPLVHWCKNSSGSCGVTNYGRQLATSQPVPGPFTFVHWWGNSSGSCGVTNYGRQLATSQPVPGPFTFVHWRGNSIQGCGVTSFSRHVRGVSCWQGGLNYSNNSRRALMPNKESCTADLCLVVLNAMADKTGQKQGCKDL